MTFLEHAGLTETIIGCGMKVHRTLGPGFLESVYQNALAIELRKSGLEVSCCNKIQVKYDDELVGDFIADMLVENCVIIENKAVRTLSDVHEMQLVHYLTATGLDVGLLLNFGAARLQFKRKARLYRETGRTSTATHPVIL
jgi:GxxExxY protein